MLGRGGKGNVCVERKQGRCGASLCGHASAAREWMRAPTECVHVELTAGSRTHGYTEDLHKAQAALAAATSAAQVDVRSKGGGVVLDELSRHRRRVSRAATVLAGEREEERV